MVTTSDIEKFFREDPFFDGEFSLSARTLDGDSILHRAIQRGATELALLILQQGAEPNERGDMGNTALHYAVAKSDVDEVIIEALLEAGADTKAVNEFGSSVADWASDSGCSATIIKKWLL